MSLISSLIRCQILILHTNRHHSSWWSARINRAKSFESDSTAIQLAMYAVLKLNLMPNTLNARTIKYVSCFMTHNHAIHHAWIHVDNVVTSARDATIDIELGNIEILIIKNKRLQKVRDQADTQLTESKHVTNRLHNEIKIHTKGEKKRKKNLFSWEPVK